MAANEATWIAPAGLPAFQSLTRAAAARSGVAWGTVADGALVANGALVAGRDVDENGDETVGATNVLGLDGTESEVGAKLTVGCSAGPGPVSVPSPPPHPTRPAAKTTRVVATSTDRDNWRRFGRVTGWSLSRPVPDERRAQLSLWRTASAIWPNDSRTRFAA